MTDLELFFGSFHPVVVHLPIGVVLVAALLHALSWLPRFRGLTSVLPWLYGAAFAGGVVAVWTGWSLAGPTGAYWDDHRWFGLGATAATGLAALATAYAARDLTPSAVPREEADADSSDVGLRSLSLKPQLLSSAVALLAVALVAWTGHQGGAITHGAGHFEQYAPAGLRAAKAEAEPLAVADRDSTLAYATLIAPIFEKKCVACHRHGLERGGLNMASFAGLTSGGHEGNAIGAGRSGELWRRVTLAPEHPRFMPTRGPALSYDELTVLGSWLDARLDSAATVQEWDPDEAALAALRHVYRVDLRPLPYVDRVKPVAIAVADHLAHWDIAPLSQEHTLLEARLLGPGPAADTQAALAELKDYAANVTYLDLRDLTGADDFLAGLPPMPHLTKVNLSRSDVTAEGQSSLERYGQLEKANYWGTALASVTEAVPATL